MARGGGKFEIVTIRAAFNRDASWGEFFIEFEKQVWEKSVIQQFETMGACSVSTMTFERGDNNESAINALYRIRELAQKYNFSCERGNLSPALENLFTAKIAVEKVKEAEINKEFSEKTAAALNFSLDKISAKVDIGNQMAEIGNQKSMAAIGELSSDVVEMKNTTGGIECKVGEIQGEVGEVKGKVGNIYSKMCFYQKRIRNLEDKNAQTTTTLNQTKGKLANATRKLHDMEERDEEFKTEIAELKGEIVELAEELLDKKKEMAGVHGEFEKKEALWENERRSLLAQIDHCKAAESLKKLMDEVHEQKRAKRARRGDP
jgi:chromosome segregation ATPase